MRTCTILKQYLFPISAGSAVWMYTVSLFYQELSLDPQKYAFMYLVVGGIIIILSGLMSVAINKAIAVFFPHITSGFGVLSEMRIIYVKVK
jgi:hypothetical protein